MQKEITLVDRGRGLQLSTSRITVHDLVPYFQRRCSYDEIIRWMPSLTHAEIGIVECATVGQEPGARRAATPQNRTRHGVGGWGRAGLWPAQPQTGCWGTASWGLPVELGLRYPHVLVRLDPEFAQGWSDEMHPRTARLR